MPILVACSSPVELANLLYNTCNWVYCTILVIVNVHGSIYLYDESFYQQISNVGTTEFSQGRTMRWGIGWSFDPSVKFPVSRNVIVSHVAVYHDEPQGKLRFPWSVKGKGVRRCNKKLDLGSVI